MSAPLPPGHVRPAVVDSACPYCGDRTNAPGHETACAVTTQARKRVTDLAGERDVHPFRAVDLWAHLRSHPRALSADQAAEAVRLVVDLGWRPVIGEP